MVPWIGGEEVTLVVLEPFGEDLVAADLVRPEVGGDAAEALGRVGARWLVVSVESNNVLARHPEDRGYLIMH